jgi:hypothetical protein
MQMILITNMGCYRSTHLTRISTPRFLGKKRRKGLQRSATIFTSSRWYSFLKRYICCIMTSWILPLGSSFQLYWWKEGKLWKDGSSRRSSIPWSTHVMNAHKHVLSWQTWNTWSMKWESFKFGMQSREYVWVVLANHQKEEHWRCNMVVAREGSNLVCFLWKHGISCRYSMSRTLFYDISISLLKTVIIQFW